MQAIKQATDVSRIAMIYCRVSGDGQRDNYSLETQEAACQELCAAEGLTVLAALREVHSGADWDRPIFQDALDYLRRGEAGVFVVHALDRFMRDQDGNVRAMFEIEQELGARAVSVLEKLGDSLEDKLLRSVYGYLAEKEREKIRERTTRGRRARVEQDGLPLPGPVAPYGYRWVYETRPDGMRRKTRLEEDPMTAPIVRRIFHEAASGASLRRIANSLDADGVPTPSQAKEASTRRHIANHWTRPSLRGILTNPCYMGAGVAYRWKTEKRKRLNPRTGRVKTTSIMRPNQNPGVPLPAESVPALVTAEEWYAVRARSARNKEEAGRNTVYPKDQLLRARVAVCAYCGRPMVVKHPRGMARGGFTPAGHAMTTLRVNALAATQPSPLNGWTAISGKR